MRFDLATLVAVRRRAEHALAVPLLFHEVRTSARARSRLERLLRWMGQEGELCTRDWLRSNDLPTDTRRRWGRGGTRRA